MRSERRGPAPSKLQFPAEPTDFCAVLNPNYSRRSFFISGILYLMLNTVAWGVWGWEFMSARAAFISLFLPLKAGHRRGPQRGQGEISGGRTARGEHSCFSLGGGGRGRGRGREGGGGGRREDPSSFQLLSWRLRVAALPGAALRFPEGLLGSRWWLGVRRGGGRGRGGVPAPLPALRCFSPPLGCAVTGNAASLPASEEPTCCAHLAQLFQGCGAVYSVCDCELGSREEPEVGGRPGRWLEKWGDVRDAGDWGGGTPARVGQRSSEGLWRM